MVLIKKVPQGYEIEEGWLVGARAYLNANQEIPTAVWTKGAFNTKSYDPGNNFNTTLYRFVAPVAGYYLINTQGQFNTAAGNFQYGISIRVNDIFTTPKLITQSVNNNSATPDVTDILFLNKNDYVEIFVYQNTGSGQWLIADVGQTYHYTYMSVFLIALA